MIDLSALEAWFVTGSQDLYGQSTLDKVAEHSQEMVRSLARAPIPVRIVYKPVTSGIPAILA